MCPCNFALSEYPNNKGIVREAQYNKKHDFVSLFSIVLVLLLTNIHMWALDLLRAGWIIALTYAMNELE